MYASLRKGLTNLYFGESKKALYFRYGLLTFDVVTISFFIVASMLEHGGWFFIADFAIAFFLIIDYVARMITTDKNGALFLNQ